MNNISDKDYFLYENYIDKYFPETYFKQYNEIKRKRFYNVVNKCIVICETITNGSNISDIQIKLLQDLINNFKKTLYVVPNNDDFQFIVIMRVISENLIRFTLASKVDIEIDALKKMSFSHLKEQLKSNSIYTEYKNEIDLIFVYFGNFSEEIHDKRSQSKKTFDYLVELMTEPPNISLANKNRTLSRYENVLIDLILPLSGITTSNIDSGSLMRLERVFGRKKYGTFPIFY